MKNKKERNDDAENGNRLQDIKTLRHIKWMRSRENSDQINSAFLKSTQLGKGTKNADGAFVSPKQIIQKHVFRVSKDSKVHNCIISGHIWDKTYIRYSN